MAKTVTSGSAAYASVADWLLRYDLRRLCDLCSDDNNRLGGPLGNATLLAASTTALELLKDASGEVEAACLVAQKYTAADLAALTGNSLALLKRIVSDLAFQFAVDRRGKDEQNEAPWKYERALEKLQQLRNGERIFAFQEVQDAGHVSESFRTEQEIENLAQTTFQSRRFFGTRAERARL